MKTMIYEPLVGTNIETACSECTKIAKQQKCRVRFSFNGVVLVAAPKKSHVTLRWEWDRIFGGKSQKYRQSKAYQQRVKAREIEVIKLKTEASVLLKALDSVLSTNGLDGLMKWMREFALIADDVAVKFDKVMLAGKLETAGFLANVGVGESDEWFKDKGNTAKYIIGQVINCLRAGMPPHPVTVSFIEKWQLMQ